MPNTTALLLINVGSPDSPKKKDVRSYLKRFLYDRRVINAPKLQRWFLVNCIIAPLRASKSAKLYKQLWSNNGFPLARYAQLVKGDLQNLLSNHADIFIGMNYGEPFVNKTLDIIKQNGYTKLIVLPLFPQYASSTTGVAIDKVMKAIREWHVIPELRIINKFYNHPLFIKAFVERIKEYDISEYDHILFSYHGLPTEHLQKMCSVSNTTECSCEQSFPPGNNMCYKAACYETTRLIAAELGLDKNSYSVGFQSHMSKNWMQPFSNKLVVAKARQGVKKLLVIAPSFVANCLETTIEIAYDYKKLFQQYGGKQLDLVESLNNSPIWIDALVSIAGLDNM